MKKIVYACDKFYDLYDAETRDAIRGLADVYGPVCDGNLLKTHPELLADLQLLMTGWGAPRIDAEFLAAAPKLEVVFYAAGSIRDMVTDEFWDSGIAVTNAREINGRAVTEFTFAQIILCLKLAYHTSIELREGLALSQTSRDKIVGAYNSVVGLISLGAIGQQVAEMLNQLDVKLIAYDPIVNPQIAERLNVELVSLETVFRESDVVSLHTPLLQETVNMIRGSDLEMMKENSSFINTSRGLVVHEQELLDVLGRRRDIVALLDVTHPEPIAVDSPLRKLPNIFLTPHIAGSMGNETFRLGREMFYELERYLAGEPLKWKVERIEYQQMA